MGTGRPNYRFINVVISFERDKNEYNTHGIRLR